MLFELCVIFIFVQRGLLLSTYVSRGITPCSAALRFLQAGEVHVEPSEVRLCDEEFVLLTKNRMY